MTDYISYDLYSGRAKHQLDYFACYDLEGDFQKVIDKLQEKLTNLQKTYKKATPVQAVIGYGSQKTGAYADGAKVKNITFDKFTISEVKDEDYARFCIYGERDILPEERAALVKQDDARKEKQKEYELKQLEILKKKYESK